MTRGFGCRRVPAGHALLKAKETLTEAVSGAVWSSSPCGRLWNWSCLCAHVARFGALLVGVVTRPFGFEETGVDENFVEDLSASEHAGTLWCSGSPSLSSNYWYNHHLYRIC